jgi:hypothetical protein
LSKQADVAYQSGPCPIWIKVGNPASSARGAPYCSPGPALLIDNVERCHKAIGTVRYDRDAEGFQQSA